MASLPKDDDMLEKVSRIRGVVQKARELKTSVEDEEQAIHSIPPEHLPTLITACQILHASGIHAVSDVKKFQNQVMQRFKDESLESLNTPCKKAMFPPAPKGMAEDATTKMKARQHIDPEYWTLTFQQWEDVLHHCTRTETYKTLKYTKKSVNMYDLTEHFVKPWTAGTGCGLATLMNKGESKPATLMLSHAWQEDVEECLKSMTSWLQREHPDQSKDTIWVWFCVFANFQCEDGSGPDIPAQLLEDPFKRVITSAAVKEHGMCAIHTTKEDLYSRLWCVYEIAAAKMQNLKVTSAMSLEYVGRAGRRMKALFDLGFDDEVCLRAAGIMCDTVKSQCGRAEDEEMLINKIIDEHKEFGRLDEVVKDFRIHTLPNQVAEMARIATFRTNDEKKFRAASARLKQMVPRPAEDVAEFYKRVEDEDGTFRRVALEELKSLAEPGDSKAIEAAMLHATDEEEEEVCAAALDTLAVLAQKGDHEVAYLALAFLPEEVGTECEPPTCVRDAAIKLLGALGYDGDAVSVRRQIRTSLSMQQQ